MSGSDDYDVAQKLKRELKKWETEFVTEHKRKPKKEDIDASPQDIQETYRSYNKLKKQIQERIDKKKESKDEKTDQIRNENQNDEKSPISAVGKMEKKIKKDSPQDTGNVDDDSVGNESEVWGRQFDRKNVKEKCSTSSETEGKKSNPYLQKLSSKLFNISKQIGDVNPSYRRSKPLIIPKETCNNASKQKSDIYDYSCDDKNSEFKIKNKLFEKAVSLTSKKSTLTDTDTEEVILPNKFTVKSKPKSSQGDYKNNFEVGKLDKNDLSTDRNWDEIDHMAPFADESHKTDVPKEAIYDNMQTAKTYKKQDSSPVDIQSNKNVLEVDIEEPMDIDDDSYKPSKRRIRKPIIRTKSIATNVDNDDVVKETGDKTLESKYDFSGEDDVPILPKHGKRKAEKSLEGQSKKRKMKVVENKDLGDETNTETEVKDPPKPKKPCAPARNKAPSSYAKSENFVRLNMKVKTYRRKGSQGKTGPQMKQFLWKQKMKSRSESYGNKCFKCGQEGHWANKCKGGVKEKEEMDDQPPVLEENFPTLRQASMMAKGIKTDAQKDKVKVSKTSKQNEDSKVEEKEKEDDDMDYLDIEAGVVRATREIQEAPPPMEPFFSLEEKNSEDFDFYWWWHVQETSSRNVLLFTRKDGAGRPEKWQPKRKKDFSCSDRLFALNIGMKFYTPEEYFLNQKPAPFTLPEFDPRKLKTTDPLCDPPDAQIVSDKQEVVVFAGYPASGKTFFGKTYLEPKGYVHINRDTLGTWQKCVSSTTKALKDGNSVMIDNTNPDTESRARYIDVAKKAGVPCRCFVLTATDQQALHNERFREIVDKTHKPINVMVMNGFKSKFKEPKLKEGFDEIVKINFVPKFDNKKHELLFKQYLLER